MVPLFWDQDVDARLHLRRWQRVVAWGGLMALGSLWCHENNRELSLCWGVFWICGMRFFGIFMDFLWTGGYPRVADMCDQHWDSYGTPNRQFVGGWTSTTSSIRDSWLVQPVGSTDSYNSWSMLSIQSMMHDASEPKLFRTMRNITWVFSSWWYRFFMFFQSIPHGPSEEKLLLSSCYVVYYKSFTELPYHSMVNRNLIDLHIRLDHQSAWSMTANSLVLDCHGMRRRQITEWFSATLILNGGQLG